MGHRSSYLKLPRLCTFTTFMSVSGRLQVQCSPPVRAAPRCGPYPNADTAQQDSRSGIISDRDIWASALLMVKCYGEDAKLEAAMRADALLEKGVWHGAAVWQQIFDAIEPLQARSRQRMSRRTRV